jgi:hypothetical protein
VWEARFAGNRESWPEHRPFRECGLARSRQTTDAVFARSASGWAELTSRDELEALRASLIRLLTKLRAE